MQFVVKQSALQNAIQTVSRAVPSRTTKPILYGMKLSADEEGLSLVAYDLEIGIYTLISADPHDSDTPTLQIGQPGEIVLSARHFSDIVRKLPHPLVRMDVNNLIVTLRSGTATYTLNGMDPREFPHLPDVRDDRGLAVPCDLLQRLIHDTAFAAAVSDTRPTLTGILFQYADGRLNFSATDSYRLATFSVEVEAGPSYILSDSIIPAKGLVELSRILPVSDSWANLRIADSQLLVEFGSTRFYSRLIEGMYPDLSRLIPSSFCTSVVLSRKPFIDTVERATIVARETDNQTLRMHVRKNEIEIMSQSLEIGKVTETVTPKSFEGSDLLLASNARYLLQALEALSTEDVRMDFTGPGSGFLIRSPEEGKDNPLHLILPVRIVT